MAEAVKMMTTGNSISSERAKELGLVDEIVQGDLLESAVLFASNLVKQGKGPRLIRNMKPKLEGDPTEFFSKLREQVAKESRGYPAPLQIVACAEAATLPFDEAEGRTRGLRQAGLSDESSAAHMFSPSADLQDSRSPGGHAGARDRSAAVRRRHMAAARHDCHAGIGDRVDTTQDHWIRIKEIRENYADTYPKPATKGEMDKRVG